MNTGGPADDPPPALLSLWYLAASLAERSGRLEYRHPLVAVRNAGGVVTGALDVVRGEPAASAIVRGHGWWARAVLGTAAAAVPPVDADSLLVLWAGFRGSTNAIALLPPEIRFARITSAAAGTGVGPTLSARLLSWADTIEDFFDRQEWAD